jgi:hypothetical protein
LGFVRISGDISGAVHNGYCRMFTTNARCLFLLPLTDGFALSPMI